MKLQSIRTGKILLFALVIYFGGSWFAASLKSQAPGQPQEYNLSGLHWRNAGPNRGGRSLAVAGSVKRPYEYYFGATGGGLWKTTDGGATWKPVTDGQIKSSSVGTVAVSESNPDIVYIGMGETELRGSVIQGDGVYKTTDGGKTWSHMGLEDTQAIARIRIDPTNPDLVYVAALGHPFGPNEERGVFRSKDGGKTWQKILFRNDRCGAIDLSVDPHNPRVLFASIWEVFRKPWTLSSGGPGSGFFKSTDGGDTWTEITRNPGLPQDLIGKINVSISGADPNRVYANVEAEDGGLFHSDDAGATWSKINTESNIRWRPFYFNRIQADPKDRDTVYAMDVGIYKSTDGGKKMNLFSTPHGDHHDLWIAPDNPDRMASADDGGGAVSVNGGKTWTLERYPTGQFYHVATTKDVPYHICGDQQDDGSACIPSSNWNQRGQSPGDNFYAVGGGEDGYIATDPTNPNIFYAGNQAAILTRYDRHTGQLQDVQVNPLFFSGMPAKDLPERWQWVFPAVFSPLDRKTLYISSQHLWKTTTEGRSWKKISPDLTRHDPSTLGDSGGPITKDQNGPEIYGTIYSVAPSYHDVNTIWVGSDDGLAHLTRDGGKHWNDITPPGLPKFSRISMIEASPHRPETAYLAANRYEVDDRQPYIFRTDDYGKTWTKIVDGIPGNDFPRSVREDPKRSGLLYASTEHGVYVSFNNGAHWQSLSLNVPDTQVSDIIVKDDDLVISTYGRSFYVLENIDVLRQLTPDVFQSDSHLFKPDVAVRPVKSANIDYFLKSSADKLTITILDVSGKTVESFTVDTKESKPDEELDPANPQPTKKPECKTGFNRFVWDLRHIGVAPVPGVVIRGAGDLSRGPAALPGNYQVQLTVNGKTQTQPLTIVKDSRLVNVAEADLQKQFDLATEVRDKANQANEMVIRIREIKEQITDRQSKAGDAKISATGDALAAKLSAVEGALYQVRNHIIEDTLSYPIKLNNQLAVLMEAIDSGDERPTVQMYAVSRELSANLDALVKKLDETVKTGLPPLNELLKAKKLEAISTR